MYQEIKNIRYKDLQITFEFHGHTILINDTYEYMIIPDCSIEPLQKAIWIDYGYLLDVLDEKE